jgi:DNA (cytosine-5)-methyltransferase 1
MRAKRELISFFSGALGLDLGLEKTGFTLKAAVECNQFAIETIKENRKHLKGKDLVLIEEALSFENVHRVCEDILKKTGLKRNSIYLLAGAPPCQPFSTAGKRTSMQDIRSCGLHIFCKQ